MTNNNTIVIAALLAAVLLTSSGNFGLFSIVESGTGQATDDNGQFALSGSSTAFSSGIVLEREKGTSSILASDYDANFGAIEIIGSYNVQCSGGEEPGEAYARILLDGTKFFEQRCTSDNRNAAQTKSGNINFVIKKEGGSAVVYQQGVVFASVPVSDGRLKFEGFADVGALGPTVSYSMSGQYKVLGEGELTTEQEVLAADLAALRAIYDDRIDYLEAALDTQLTPEEFEFLMSEYRQLIEEETDARLIEKLNLLRNDFQTKLDSYEPEVSAAEFSVLQEEWAETIPVLELSIKALQDKQEALETRIDQLEKELRDAEAAQNAQEAAEIQSDIDVLLDEQSDVNEAIQSTSGFDQNILLLLLGAGLLFVMGKKQGGTQFNGQFA